MGPAGTHAAASPFFDPAFAARIPELIRFGTSSWTYEGWKNQIYFDNYKSERAFRQNSLAEYARCPLFRSVGIDSFFYTPPKRETLQQYAACTPADFRWVSKVWEEITVPRYASHPRYGAKAGKENSNFLNAGLFANEVLGVIAEDSAVRERTGPFVFQFQTLGKELTQPPERFFEKLDSFFAALPKDFLYAVEVRNPELLSEEYFSLLNRHGVSHCFNHWNYMPALADQMKAAAAAGGLTAAFYLARILTPRGVSYQQAVERFQPYDRLQEAIPSMRLDVGRLIRRALEKRVPAFVIVNNRAEGNSPQTIAEIAAEVFPAECSAEDDPK